jgi:molecular chaperone DnaK
MGKVVGIDLGTTFSSIAFVNKHGKAEIIANREGERITPSVVLFDGNIPVVGSIAKRSAIANPLNVAQFVKRQMGNPFWKFRTESGETYTPEEISAIILKRLKEDAESFFGEKISDAVITVPAYFNDAQRKSTQDAGRIAGINVMRIINEPTAAALSYGYERIQKPQNILVYDLGGGTFDVTIMQASKGEIKVIATGGDKNLGGFDWDNEIMNFLNDEFKNQGGVDLFEEPVLEQDLRDKSEIAKKTLSTREKTSIFISAGGKNLSIDLTREQFESLTAPLLNRTATIMEFVLEDSGLKWNDIDKILLVGGSTRMKAVPSVIEKDTGKKPSTEVHPDEVVALGAALQAFLIQMKKVGERVDRIILPSFEIEDVNSHSLGIIALDKDGKEFNSIILKKDSQIPCKVSDVFCTVIENQTELRIRVTEGEVTDPTAVTIHGETILKISPYPSGAPVEVFFEYDHNGIIHVTVIDLTARRSLGEMELVRTSNLSEIDVKNKQEKIRNLIIN